MSEHYCANMLLNRIFCSYGNCVSPYRISTFEHLWSCFLSTILLHKYSLKKYSSHNMPSPRVQTSLFLSLSFSLPLTILLITSSCTFISLLTHNRHDIRDIVLKPMTAACVLCVRVHSFRISFQAGKTLIPRHSCAPHPLPVYIFLHASAANETKGWNKAQFKSKENWGESRRGYRKKSWRMHKKW